MSQVFVSDVGSIGDLAASERGVLFAGVPASLDRQMETTCQTNDPQEPSSDQASRGREKEEVSFIEIKVVQEMNDIRIMASAVALAELSSLHGQFFCMFYHHHLESFIEELVLRITSG